MGGIIASIQQNSIADELEWQPGDEVVSINGHDLRDVIDFRFHSADEHIIVALKRDCEVEEFEIEKDPDEPLGVEFTDILFDGVRTCGAHCVFCFVEQLPRGLRKALYLKDDDYRLSFLHGNFVTLGNVTEGDLRRIIEQRLSPLYVSVHTTDARLREVMLGRESPDVLAQIDTLAQGRIILHTQIVLCRGINDGRSVERTVMDLAERHPAVESIAIVPAGITAHRRHETPIPSIDPDYSTALLRRVRRWQRLFMVEKGTRLVWAADEFYLNAGLPLPLGSSYEGYPQLENGVGLARQFKDSVYRANTALAQRTGRPFAATVVTGALAAPLLAEWADSIRAHSVELRVVPITNTLFGETVTVAGLIPGRDVIEQLRGKDLGEAVFVPDVSVRDGAFLDDVTVRDVERELGRPVVVVRPRPYWLVREILQMTESA